MIMRISESSDQIKKMMSAPIQIALRAGGIQLNKLKIAVIIGYTSMRHLQDGQDHHRAHNAGYKELAGIGQQVIEGAQKGKEVRTSSNQSHSASPS